MKSVFQVLNEMDVVPNLFQHFYLTSVTYYIIIMDTLIQKKNELQKKLTWFINLL